MIWPAVVLGGSSSAGCCVLHCWVLQQGGAECSDAALDAALGAAVLGAVHVVMGIAVGVVLGGAVLGVPVGAVLHAVSLYWVQ